MQRSRLRTCGRDYGPLAGRHFLPLRLPRIEAVAFAVTCAVPLNPMQLNDDADAGGGVAIQPPRDDSRVDTFACLGEVRWRLQADVPGSGIHAYGVAAGDLLPRHIGDIAFQLVGPRPARG